MRPIPQLSWTETAECLRPRKFGAGEQRGSAGAGMVDERCDAGGRGCCGSGGAGRARSTGAQRARWAGEQGERARSGEQGEPRSDGGGGRARSGGEEGELALERADEAFQRFDVEAMIAHLSAARARASRRRATTAGGDGVRPPRRHDRQRDRQPHRGRAWFVRARRLVDDEPPCIEQGWVARRRDGVRRRRPGRAAGRGRAGARPSSSVRRRQPRDQGARRRRAGPRAGAAGSPRAWRCSTRRWRWRAVRPTTASTAAKSVCSFFTACYFSADFERAGQLDRPAASPRADRSADRRGRVPVQPLRQRAGRAARRAGAVERGRGSSLERSPARVRGGHAGARLAPGHRAGRPAHPPGPPHRSRAAARRQGPVVQALLPSARLHLARGDHELARAAARRGLRSWATTGCGRSSCSSCSSTPSWRAGDVEARRGRLRRAGRGVTARSRRPAAAGRAAPARRRRASAARRRRAARSRVLEPALDRLDPAAAAVAARPPAASTLGRLRELAGDAAGGPARRGCRRRPLLAAPRRRARRRRRGACSTAYRTSDECAGGVDGRDARPRRQVVDGVARRHHACGSPTRRACATSPSSSARPGVERHALDLVDRVEGVDPPASTGGALGDAGALLDGAGPQRRTGTGSRRCGPTSTTRSSRGRSTRPRRSRTSSTSSSASWPRRSGSAAASRARRRPPSGPGSTSPAPLRAAIAKLAEALPRAGAALDRARPHRHCTACTSRSTATCAGSFSPD